MTLALIVVRLGLFGPQTTDGSGESPRRGQRGTCLFAGLAVVNLAPTRTRKSSKNLSRSEFKVQSRLHTGKDIGLELGSTSAIFFIWGAADGLKNSYTR